MDLNRLQYFLVVAETEQIKKASEVLGISSPAISKALKILENEIGHQLIKNEGRGIVLTEKGRELAKVLKPQLQFLSELKKNLDQDQRLQNKITLGTFEVFSTYFLGDLIKNTLYDFIIDVHELIPGKIEEALNQHIIDYGITYLPIPYKNIEHIKIGEVAMGIFAKKNHFKNLSIEELPFVAPRKPLDASPTRVKGLDGWPDDKITRNIKYQVDLMESALELLRQGVAVAYLPIFIIEKHNKYCKPEFQLVEIKKDHRIKKQKQAVYLVKRSNDSENAIDRKLARDLRSILSH